MSFIGKTKQGRGFEAGYFLESEVGLVRKTVSIPQAGAKDFDGEKYVLAGTLWSGTYGGATVNGIVYEDVNVTSGEMPGSVVLAGRVYKDRVPSATSEGTADNTNIVYVDNAPTVTRPDAE